MAVRYVGVADIAAWFGVSPQTVSKWLDRYAETHPTPEPNVLIGDLKGWLPSRESEWREWAEGRPGQGAGGGPKPRERSG